MKGRTGIYRPVASGSVTQANMRLSGVNGTAFVDFTAASVLTGKLGNLLRIKDSTGKVIQGFIKAAGTGETLGVEIAVGTLTALTLYKITATELNHFGTGLEVDDYFVSGGTETCDANNKVKQVTVSAVTGVTIVTTKGGSTFNWATKDTNFNWNDASGYTYEILKVNEATVVATHNINAYQTLINYMPNSSAFAVLTGIDLSVYQTGKYLLALYDVNNCRVIAWISATAPAGETLGSEISSGGLTWRKLYKITATDLDHFRTGLGVGDYFTADGSESVLYMLQTLNNKVYSASGGAFGRLYEWDGVSAWTEKAPALGNGYAFRAGIVHNGKLYAGVYSVYPGSTGGDLYEWNGVNAWVQVAPSPNLRNVTIDSLCVFNNKIYGGTTYGALYEWNGTDAWVQVAPDSVVNDRVRALCVFNGELYGGIQNGTLRKWNGVDAWVQVAPAFGTETVCYSLAVFNNELYGGMGSLGKLYKWNGTNAWTEVAPQLGTATLIWSLIVFNNKLYGGTAQGQLYEWNGTNAWIQVAPTLGSGSIYSMTICNSKLYGVRGATMLEWNGVDAWATVATAFITETCDVNNKVKQVTVPAATGALLLSSQGGSRGWLAYDIRFNFDAAVTAKILYKGD